MPRAYVFTEYGGPETQSLVQLPKPEPGPGELLVAVRAAGVNPADWKFRAGYMSKFVPLQLPAVFGSELSGVVEQLGEGVEGFAVGDEVFGNPVAGGYAEYALLPAAVAARKPAGVSFTHAATLPVAAALGVTHVTYGDGVADRIRAVAPDGVDAIFDLVGGDALRSVAGLVMDPSKLITAADPTTAAEYGGGAVARARNSEVLDAVAALVESGALNPFVTKVFPFDQAAQALAVVEAGHAEGKVVLEIS